MSILNTSTDLAAQLCWGSYFQRDDPCLGEGRVPMFENRNGIRTPGRLQAMRLRGGIGLITLANRRGEY